MTNEQSLNGNLEKYYSILSEEFPEFLNSYINTPEMQKQGKISVSCGNIYSKLFEQEWYSSLDHSIAVALIIWHFTKDKKQTLSGLFHDISTPVFKHTIDFLNKDYEKQESTEELTKKIIMQSNEIMSLLKKDKIDINEVYNYHIYPIADNDTPRLSSDRLEYTFSNGLGAIEKLWSLNEVKEIYDDIEIQENEEQVPELGFKNVEIAEKFVHTMSILSSMYNRDKTVYSMQFLADIIKEMADKKIISANDLYKLTEKEIIEKIENCTEKAMFYNEKEHTEKTISEVFEEWKKATEICTSEEEPKNRYYVSVKKVKIRYINPLVKNAKGYKRIFEISESAKGDIQKALNHKNSKYIYI